MLTVRGGGGDSGTMCTRLQCSQGSVSELCTAIWGDTLRIPGSKPWQGRGSTWARSMEGQSSGRQASSPGPPNGAGNTYSQWLKVTLERQQGLKNKGP